MEKKIKLTDGDKVKFGKLNSVWDVHQLKLVTCTSTVKGENLENLKYILNKLGAEYKNDWTDSCSYLTMPAITLTIKVVLALVQGASIVTLDYWNKCLQAVENNLPLPDAKNYVPQVIESTLNKEHVSFIPDDKRKNIFQNNKFVFFSKRQMEMYKTILIKSAASPVLLSEAKLTKSALCNDNVVVIQYNILHVNQDTQAQKNQIDDIVNFLKSQGKRVVPDAEIGLAILFCSTSKYCNPNFNFSTEIVKQALENNPKGQNILAPESQEPLINRSEKENIVIDESLVSNQDRSAKRKFDGDGIESNSNKKIATNKNVHLGTDNYKRKLSEDESSLNPNKKMALENDNDNFFNFLNPETGNDEKNTEKRLNFTKPVKRKADTMDDDEDLFNFIQDSSKPSDNDHNNKRRLLDVDQSPQRSEKTKVEDEVDVTALRGSKLDELKRNILDINYKVIKKENSDELETKMNNLDLGTTIVTISDDLIVKKEPLKIEEISPMGKNFKKFKKVWPVKMQVSVVPKSISLNSFETNKGIMSTS